MVQFEIAAIYSPGPDQADGDEVLHGWGVSAQEGGRARRRQGTDASLSN